MSQTKSNASFLYIAALICLLAVGLFMFTKSDFFMVQEVRIQGLDNVAEEEIVKLLGTVRGQNIFLTDTKSLAERVKLHPLVDVTIVKKELPVTLVIDIQERVPVALILNEDGVVEVDNQGTILRFHETWPKTSSPVVTGVVVPDTIGPGQKLVNAQLEKVLLLLGQAPQSIIPLIGEVSINKEEQVFLFLTTGMEVRLGYSEEYAGKLNLLNELIHNEEYMSIEKSIKYIDLTAGKPVLGR